jgi:hypothetical protein
MGRNFPQFQTNYHQSKIHRLTTETMTPWASCCGSPTQTVTNRREIGDNFYGGSFSHTCNTASLPIASF